MSPDSELPADMASAKHALNLMGAADTLKQMYEFAGGQKIVLREAGWSETAAEMVGVNILNHLVDMAFVR